MTAQQGMSFNGGGGVFATLATSQARAGVGVDVNSSGVRLADLTGLARARRRRRRR